MVKSRVRNEVLDSMADLMENIFHSGMCPIIFDPVCLQGIHPFVLKELEIALKQMARGRCKDKAGICLEMITSAGSVLHECLVKAYNCMLRLGDMDAD